CRRSPPRCRCSPPRRRCLPPRCRRSPPRRRCSPPRCRCMEYVLAMPIADIVDPNAPRSTTTATRS
ncbi:MAG: hypothetical protein E2O39_16745, partial [Planctomycetota bacterium]